MINAQKLKLQEQVSYWISLEREGINLQENKEFISWLTQSKRNKLAYDEEKEFLSQIDTLPTQFLDELKNDIKKENKNIIFSKTFISVLSAACVLCVLYFSFFSNSTTYSKDYLASKKVRENIVLPDNSIVALDANTKMSVKYYKNKRIIHLSKGRAFFNVAPNKNRPFIINTQNVNIKVLGTKFEVVNTSKGFEVNVKEGKVRVADQHDKLLDVVTKAQALSLDNYNNIISLKKTDISNLALWSEGKLTFNQINLEDAIKEFAKYIDLHVKIENKNIALLPVSGNFTSKDFEKFIKVLPLIHPLKIERNQEKIIIKEKI